MYIKHLYIKQRTDGRWQMNDHEGIIYIRPTVQEIISLLPPENQIPKEKPVPQAIIIQNETLWTLRNAALSWLNEHPESPLANSVREAIRTTKSKDIVQ